MREPPTLGQLLDDAALYSFEHQLHLADVIGEHRWDADLDVPRFAFRGEHPVTCTQVHLLGTAAPGPRSWLWGWANPSGYSETVVAVGRRVREFGRTNGIPELGDAEVPFDALPGSPTEPHEVVGIMIDLAKAVTGHWTSYNAQVGGGTRLAFLLDHPEFQLPAPQPARVLRVLTQSVAELRLSDHRRALHGYGARRGLGAEFSPDRSQLTLTGPGLRATVTFDEQGRAAKIGSSMAGSG